MTNNFTRRHFIKRGGFVAGLSALACGAPLPAFAQWVQPKGARVLTFHNLHTDEKLQIKYWQDGFYDRAAWAKMNHILRDHYSGDIRVMDLRLMDLVHDLQRRLNNDRAVEIISGYRSPATNMHLAKMGDGVAKNSLHMEGKAIDIRLDGTPLPDVHKVALQMDRGGVGYYPDSQFVHLDVGPKDRRWG